MKNNRPIQNAHSEWLKTILTCTPDGRLPCPTEEESKKKTEENTLAVENNIQAITNWNNTLYALNEITTNNPSLSKFQSDYNQTLRVLKTTLDKETNFLNAISHCRTSKCFKEQGRTEHTEENIRIAKAKAIGELKKEAEKWNNAVKAALFQKKEEAKMTYESCMQSQPTQEMNRNNLN